VIKDLLSNADEKMVKSIDVLKRELSSLKAGKANAAMLDKILVECYGSKNNKINALANISVPEPRILQITPYDKSTAKNIEKAIQKSDLGINPSSDGNVIRLVVPELTEETRKNLAKNIKKQGEDIKVAIRAIRREANEKLKKMKKDEDISEDEIKNAENELQKKTDNHIKDIDKIIENKEKEIMAI